MTRRVCSLMMMMVMVGLSLAAPRGAGAGTVIAVGEYGAPGSQVLDRFGVFAVDTRSGTRAILSAFDDPSQGPLGREPRGVAVSPRGRIFVLDREAGAYASFGVVFAVDTRGRRTVLSDLSDPAQGPTGINPEGIAVGRSGVLYVVDSDAGRDNAGIVLAIDPRSGARRLVTAFGDPAQGPALRPDPYGVAVQRDGTLLVYDDAALYAVDPNDGQRTVLSVFDELALGPRIGNPKAIASTPAGDVLVADPDFAPRTRLDGGTISGAVLRIDPLTGLRSVLSESGEPSQGPLLFGPRALATAGSRSLYAWSSTPDEGGGIFAIDVSTGRRTLVAELAMARTGWRSFATAIAYHPARLVSCARRAASCISPLAQLER